MPPIELLGLTPGDVLEGRYVLLERIGQGGMGCVFLADQSDVQRTVAIKVLHPELATCPESTRRIRDEAIAAGRVHDPHCVTVVDHGVLPDGVPYVVMGYVPGRSLGRVIAEEPIPLERAIDLCAQILSALAATHAAGIIHADVKSDNFLVERRQGRDHVTLIDFGLALAVDAPVDLDVEDGHVMVSGTPEYMAPEVVGGDAPMPASDLYGAGVILYELLTGATPFGGGTATEIMLRHVHDAVIPPSLRRPDRDIPHLLDLVVVRALAKRPGARFPDAAAFAAELRAAAGAPRAALRAPSARNDRSPPGAPTRVCTTPLPRRRLARGSDYTAIGPTAELQALRARIRAARAHGDVAQIARGYLDLAVALAGEQRFAAAARALEEGIDLLTPRRGAGAIGGPDPVEQLVAALAALAGVRDQAAERRPVPRAARVA